MNTLENLKKELNQEYETTRSFIANFPSDKNNFKPHEKSMQIMPLATHLVEIFAWPEMIFKTEKLDFAAGDYKPTYLDTKKELVEKMERDFEKGKQSLECNRRRSR
jgi:hypothetical protein